MDTDTVYERRELRGALRIFRDRSHAGELLSELLAEHLQHLQLDDGLVLAVPAGGVPVAVVVAERLGLPLDVAVVSKITLPWNTEAGYGAVAFDGSIRINRGLAARVGLSGDEIQQGIEQTKDKVARRSARLRGSRPLPELTGRPLILVDDGLASGFTMLAAIDALGPERLVVAVPTAPEDTALRIAERVAAVCCVNLREGRPFAVADAYEYWSDVAEETAAELLRSFYRREPG
jgi:predicted phosphoribosyltransferase